MLALWVVLEASDRVDLDTAAMVLCCVGAGVIAVLVQLVGRLLRGPHPAPSGGRAVQVAIVVGVAAFGAELALEGQVSGAVGRLAVVLGLAVIVDQLAIQTESRELAAALDASDEQHRAARDLLEHLTSHDALTGLGNRAMLVEHLGRALREACPDRPAAALLVDLDQFKVVNESLGHDAGDRLLLVTAARLQEVVGPAGLVTRFGGDEFCVVLRPAPVDCHVRIASEVTSTLRAPVDLGGPGLTHPSASGGLAIGRPSVDVETLLSEADSAVFRAKHRGRDRVEICRPSDRRDALDTHRLVGELHRALDHGELVVHHQPVFDTATERIVGTEALVRWQHPERGLQMPGAFLPVAEASGLIVPLGEQVLRRACADAAVWNRAGLGAGGAATVAVNVDVQQLTRAEFPDVVAEILAETGLAAEQLWLEITESTLMADVRSVERSLVRLRDMGVHLSVDDFGTGYSSLTYLKRFPVEALKIDRSFIVGLGVHLDDTEIVSALVSLGQRLDLAVVAEGVEQRHQLDVLRVLGCPLTQGFLLGVPVAEPELRMQLERQRNLEWRSDSLDAPGPMTGSAPLGDVATMRGAVPLSGAELN